MTANAGLCRRDLLAGLGVFAASAAVAQIGRAAIPSYDRPYQGCEYLTRLDKVYDFAVKPRMAMRLHRLHHLMWHTVRNSWMYFPDSLESALAEIKWGRAMSESW